MQRNLEPNLLWKNGRDKIKEAADYFSQHRGKFTVEKKISWQTIAKSGIEKFATALHLFIDLQTHATNKVEKTRLTRILLESEKELKKTKHNVEIFTQKINEELEQIQQVSPITPTFFKQKTPASIKLRELKEYVTLDEKASQRQIYLLWNKVPDRDYTCPQLPLSESKEAEVSLYYNAMLLGKFQPICDEEMLKHADTSHTTGFWQKMVNYDNVNQDLQEARQINLLTFAKLRVIQNDNSATPKLRP